MSADGKSFWGHLYSQSQLSFCYYQRNNATTLHRSYQFSVIPAPSSPLPLRRTEPASLPRLSSFQPELAPAHPQVSQFTPVVNWSVTMIHPACFLCRLYSLYVPTTSSRCRESKSVDASIVQQRTGRMFGHERSGLIY